MVLSASVQPYMLETASVARSMPARPSRWIRQTRVSAASQQLEGGSYLSGLQQRLRRVHHLCASQSQVCTTLC